MSPRDLALRAYVAGELARIGYRVVVPPRTPARLPGLLVGHPEWFEGGWLGLDVRTLDSRLDAPLRERIASGSTLLARSADEAVRCLAAFELALQSDSPARLFLTARERAE